MPTCRDVGHAYSIFLRMYTAACGFALMGIAVFVIVSSIEIAASVESDDCATGELFFTCPQVMQLALGVIALAIFEVLFGGLIVAAEFHVKIVARYFGFMCTYVGKGLFVFFCGVVVASLGLAYASFERGNIAPVVVGSCMLAAGVLQMLCVVPCWHAARLHRELGAARTPSPWHLGELKLRRPSPSSPCPSRARRDDYERTRSRSTIGRRPLGL